MPGYDDERSKKRMPNADKVSHREKGICKKSLVNSIEQAEEVKALAREKLFRNTLDEAVEWAKAFKQQKLKKKFGPINIQRVPTEILNKIDWKDLKDYMSVLKQASATQAEAIKQLDPFSQRKLENKLDSNRKKASKEQQQKEAQGELPEGSSKVYDLLNNLN